MQGAVQRPVTLTSKPKHVREAISFQMPCAILTCGLFLSVLNKLKSKYVYFPISLPQNSIG